MSDPRVRAAQARRRAEQARLRAVGLRQRRMMVGEHSSPGTLNAELEDARAHAIDALEHLLAALEASADAHVRAAERYEQRLATATEGTGEPFAEKAADHRVKAEEDRVRAREMRRVADSLFFGDEA